MGLIIMETKGLWIAFRISRRTHQAKEWPSSGFTRSTSFSSQFGSELEYTFSSPATTTEATVDEEKNLKVLEERSRVVDQKYKVLLENRKVDESYKPAKVLLK